MVDLKQCPACGAPVPEQIPSGTEQFPNPPLDQARPSTLFVLATGVAAPTICGGVTVLIFYCFWQEAITAGAVLAGAGFIAFVVRWVNRRDMPAGREPLD